MTLARLASSVWQTLTGKRLRESREERRVQNAAIKTAIVEGETRRIRELEERVKDADDPRVAELLESEAGRHRRRLDETQEIIRSLGI